MNSSIFSATSYICFSLTSSKSKRHVLYLGINPLSIIS
ncbi:hypothetical protein TorRG33x02_213540 [Trema orientale]|uniref:Uncharacterized protein n=1 Tax=Trema orientale TaxID=63057 RepID=A0A2P5EB94_TREOI|nr:hypothetical protein TorRG33x02_213540 [Trema orientale]